MKTYIYPYPLSVRGVWGGRGTSEVTIYYQSSQVKSNWAELVDVSELKVDFYQFQMFKYGSYMVRLTYEALTVR